MKRILQNSFGKTILCLLVALMSGGTAWANGNYTSRAGAYAVGEGKVYVSKTQVTNPSYPEDEFHSVVTESGSNQNHPYYLYAQANTGYYFDGWYDDAQLKNKVSPDSPYHVTIHVNGKAYSRWSSEIVAKNWYAQFLPKHVVEFKTSLTIPYGAPTPYPLTTDTSGTVDVKTDGNISSVTVTGNDKIVSVSGSTITPAAVGTTTITVASAEGPTYLAGNGTITVNVTAPEGMTTAPSGEYTETYKIPASGYGT